jgi:hypothetical protein
MTSLMTPIIISFLLWHCATRREVSGSVSCGVLLPAFSSPGVHSAFNRNEHQGICLGLKWGRLVEFDSFAVQVVSDVKRMEAQRFVPFLGLHDLLPFE